MIEWYKDEELCIEFDNVPHVCVRYILPSSTPLEIKSIKKYPFINKTTLKVKITDFLNDKIYEFTIPKGYTYDGATIPKFFHRIIGSKTDNTFLIGALIHDVLCENHSYIDNNRNLSSRIFRALLITGGVGKVKAQIMYLSVDNFQRFCGWEK